MAGKLLKHNLFVAKERDYWKNVHVNIDAICDNWEEKYKDELVKHLDKLPELLLSDILKFYRLAKRPGNDEVQTILSDEKSSIDLLCALDFSLANPKSISQLFGIPIRSGKVNKPAVIKKVLEYHETRRLPEIFIYQLQQRLGTGFYHFYFEKSLSDKEFATYSDAVVLLARALKRYDKEHKIYHFRSAVKTANGWLFLLLKETQDIIFPAIPNNARVLKGTYLLIHIDPGEKKLEINTQSKVEAYRIKDYLIRKTKNNLKYSRKTATYNPSDFLNEIKKEKDTKSELVLTEVEFRDSKIKSSLKVYDALHKNDIFSQLNILKAKDVIKLEDFSEFKNLHFSYKGLMFAVNVEGTDWGQIRLKCNDRNKPAKEKGEFERLFATKFKVPLDVYLNNADSTVDVKKIARKVLGKNTLEAALPKETEDVLLDLINLKILDKPSSTARRRCENPDCRKLTWAKGDCPSCGNTLLIEGNYIDLKMNKKAIYDFVYKKIYRLKLYSVERVKKQIEGTSFQFIDLIDKQGNSLTVYITTTTVPEKVLKHFQETGSPLLIILSKFKEALYKDIKEKGFECTDIADIYSIKDDEKRIGKNIQEWVERQKQLWQRKIIEKGYASYTSLLDKTTRYTDQQFEKDIYNILHELFLIADRLGGKFAGVTAPDGIASFQNYSIPYKRSCIAWDCKYSVTKKGYQLNDKPGKHRKYINALKANSKIVLYGGLHTYAIISQNMDMARYERFYTMLTKGYRWKGNVVFIEEKQILNLYKLYKGNEQVIQNHPKLFFNELYLLLHNIWKKDSVRYKRLSAERFTKMAEKVESLFAKHRIAFSFERSEFQ